MNLLTGNDSYLQFQLSNFTDTQTLVDAIRRIPYCGGDTNTARGLQLARTEIFNASGGDRPDMPNVIVLVVDGNPTRDVEVLGEEVQRIKDLGIRIIGVGVTDAVS